MYVNHRGRQKEHIQRSTTQFCEFFCVDRMGLRLRDAYEERYQIRRDIEHVTWRKFLTLKHNRYVEQIADFSDMVGMPSRDYIHYKLEEREQATWCLTWPADLATCCWQGLAAEN